MLAFFSFAEFEKKQLTVDEISLPVLELHRSGRLDGVADVLLPTLQDVLDAEVALLHLDQDVIALLQDLKTTVIQKFEHGKTFFFGAWSTIEKVHRC